MPRLTKRQGHTLVLLLASGSGSRRGLAARCEEQPFGSATANEPRKTRYDGLGRVFQTRSSGKVSSGSAEEIRVVSTFDDRGRLATRTIPHRSGTTTPEKQSIAYDLRDRVRETRDFDGKTITRFAYDAWATTEDVFFGPTANASTRQRREVRTLDGLGRMVRVDQYDDASSPTTPFSLTATYDAMDRLTSIQDAIGTDVGLCNSSYNMDPNDPNDPTDPECDPANHTTALTYDAYRRRTSFDLGDRLVMRDRRWLEPMASATWPWVMPRSARGSARRSRHHTIPLVLLKC